MKKKKTGEETISHHDFLKIYKEVNMMTDKLDIFFKDKNIYPNIHKYPSLAGGPGYPVPVNKMRLLNQLEAYSAKRMSINKRGHLQKYAVILQVKRDDIVIEDPLLYKLVRDNNNIAERWNKTALDHHERKKSIKHHDIAQIYLAWFDDRGIDSENVSSLVDDRINIDFLPNWGKKVVLELVKVWKEGLESIKHDDLAIRLSKKYSDFPESGLKHLSHLFKSNKANNFYKIEIYRDGAQWSLKNPDKIDYG